ncbi:helix-turn-helix domain-containing protein [Haloarcula hispanica]|nr:helix-turn-helix domain-containing protein [Haloarcula hispanica]
MRRDSERAPTITRDEIRAGLRKLGPNSYEAQAYTTLLEHGVLTAVEVANRSSIPGSRTQGVLADLKQDGYIETFEGGTLNTCLQIKVNGVAKSEATAATCYGRPNDLDVIRCSIRVCRISD